MDETDYYATRVEDIRPDGIVIAMPMRKAVPVFLPEGELFEGKLIKDGVLYAFQSCLRSRSMVPLPVWLISEPSTIKKIQLRSFVRLDIGLPAALWTLDDDGNRQEATKQTAVTRNISGGGALVGSPIGYEKGTTVAVRLTCDKETTIDIIGKIVRSVPEFRDAGAPPLYSLGIQYIDLEERQRRRIIQFINAKQIERRQRGVY